MHRCSTPGTPAAASPGLPSASATPARPIRGQPPRPTAWQTTEHQQGAAQRGGAWLPSVCRVRRKKAERREGRGGRGGRGEDTPPTWGATRAEQCSASSSVSMPSGCEGSAASLNLSLRVCTITCTAHRVVAILSRTESRRSLQNLKHFVAISGIAQFPRAIVLPGSRGRTDIRAEW